jgi:hypothetical protein
MGFFEGASGILAIVALFIVLPSMIISAVRKNSRHKREIELEKLKYQKEIMELEIEKQNNQIKLLEEENKKYDNIINGS